VDTRAASVALCVSVGGHTGLDDSLELLAEQPQARGRWWEGSAASVWNSGSGGRRPILQPSSDRPVPVSAGWRCRCGVVQKGGDTGPGLADSLAPVGVAAGYGCG